MGTRFLSGGPYQDDIMSLPVVNLDEAVPYYEQVMGFKTIARYNSPVKSAILERDNIRIGFSENGEDPKQDGAFFEVDDVEAAFEEMRINGLGRDDPNYRVDQWDEKSYKVFFVVAPDELCYCIGQLN